MESSQTGTDQSIQALILSLLEQSVFIKEETKTLVRSRLPEFSAEKLEEIKTFLDDHIKRQDAYFTEKVANDPNFLSNLKHLVTAESLEANAAREKVDRQTEKDELLNLDNELNDIFS